MKKTIFLLTAAFLTISFTSCDKDDNNDPQEPGETTEVSIDATSKTAWNYYSLSEGKLIGSADESAENNATWGARKDWDIAIQRYNIRTNSGAFTTVDARGGVYTYDANTKFSSVANVPSAVQFVEDKAITSEGMGGTTTVVRSDATVILFKTNEDGSMIMPPVYLQAPVYIFRSADGSNFYKVQFTQYVNENNVTGHVKFNAAQIYQQ